MGPACGLHQAPCCLWVEQKPLPYQNIYLSLRKASPVLSLDSCSHITSPVGPGCGIQERRAEQTTSRGPQKASKALQCFLTTILSKPKTPGTGELEKVKFNFFQWKWLERNRKCGQWQKISEISVMEQCLYFETTFLVKRLFVNQRNKGQIKTFRLTFSLWKEMLNTVR